jgi:hypothetical protein
VWIGIVLMPDSDPAIFIDADPDPNPNPDSDYA